MPVEIEHIVCLGMGYSAIALARHASRQGIKITGSSRTTAGVERLQAAGFEGVLFDGTRAEPDITRTIATASHVLISTPPGAMGDPVLRHLSQALATAKDLTWIGYLSTIGVYGDHNGGWVDEDTQPAPKSVRSQERLAAENAWRDFARSSPARIQIFRLPGIYGPGRSAIEDLKAGTARRIVKEGQVFNRIHVEDLARVLLAAMAIETAAPLYNVVDNEPASSADVIAYAASLLRLPVPDAIPFETANLSTMARSFYSECKRVGNTRVLHDLGLSLAYPTYREGLAQVIAANEG